MRFFLAILVAILWSDLNRQLVHRALGLLLMLRSLVLGPQVPPPIFHRRMAYCHDCPIFFSPLQTCGSPLAGTSGGHPVGCWCHMPNKARLPGATCWLNDTPHAAGLGWGWPRELENLP